MKRSMMTVAMIWVIAASAAWADDWRTVATLTAGDGAKEVQVNQQISKVMFVCTDGNIIINTFVVRDGDNKTSHRVGARIEKGKNQTISVGDKVNCSGLRISDDGRGTYEVKVRK